MERLCEIYRYMGIKNSEEISDTIKDRVSELLCRAKKLADFKYVFKCFDISFTQNDETDFGAFRLKSAALKKNLSGCKKAIVFVATLGMEYEKALQAFSLSEPSDALIFQAIGAELLEDFADRITKEVFLKDFPEGFGVRPRFSPGYSDLDMSSQKVIFNILKPEKYIGAYLTDSLMMVPSKTVSAIVGITDTPYDFGGGCENCKKEDCLFRKEGL